MALQKNDNYKIKTISRLRFGGNSAVHFPQGTLCPMGEVGDFTSAHGKSRNP